MNVSSTVVPAGSPSISYSWEESVAMAAMVKAKASVYLARATWKTNVERGSQPPELVMRSAECRSNHLISAATRSTVGWVCRDLADQSMGSDTVQGIGVFKVSAQSPTGMLTGSREPWTIIKYERAASRSPSLSDESTMKTGSWSMS